jgi:hypothetical protein
MSTPCGSFSNQHDTRYITFKNGNEMEKKLSIVAGILVVAILFSYGSVQAESYSHGLPLSALDGNWAGQGSAIYSACYSSDFGANVDCVDAPNAVSFNQVVLDQFTQDTNGNSCGFQSANNIIPFPPHFPFVGGGYVTSFLAGKVSSYNQATETGDITYALYANVPGVSCNGSTLVNTSSTAPYATATVAFTLSQSGNRIDAIVVTFNAEPINYIDNYVGSGYLNRQ